MNTIQTENGTYVEVTEAEKVAIDKKWDYLEALTKERIAIAKKNGSYDSTMNYFSYWDNESTVAVDDTALTEGVIKEAVVKAINDIRDLG